MRFSDKDSSDGGLSVKGSVFTYSRLLNMEMLTSDITIVTQNYGHGRFQGLDYC